MKNIKLHRLACELAKRDAPGGYNASIVETETALSALGQKLRSCSVPHALEILSAITGRSGKKRGSFIHS